MQWATLGKNGSEAASQLQGQIARAFSSNSLVNAMDTTAAIQYILTATQSLGNAFKNLSEGNLSWKTKVGGSIKKTYLFVITTRSMLVQKKNECS